MQLKHFCRPLQWGILHHVLLQWRRCFRDEYDFMSRYLFPTDELATDYPGKDVPWDQGYRVVIHKNGTIVGIDDEDCYNRLTFTKADIIKYRFDLKMFRRETSDCLGLKPDTDEIDPKSGIEQRHCHPERDRPRIRVHPKDLAGGRVEKIPTEKTGRCGSSTV